MQKWSGSCIALSLAANRTRDPFDVGFFKEKAMTCQKVYHHADVWSAQWAHSRDTAWIGISQHYRAVPRPVLQHSAGIQTRARPGEAALAREPYINDKVFGSKRKFILARSPKPKQTLSCHFTQLLKITKNSTNSTTATSSTPRPSTKW